MIVCRWHGCGKATKTISSHLAKRHVPSGEKSYACEWEGCSRQKVYILIFLKKIASLFFSNFFGAFTHKNCINHLRACLKNPPRYFHKAPFFKRSAIIKHLKLHIRTLGVDDLDLITTENGDPVLGIRIGGLLKMLSLTNDIAQRDT